MSILKQVASAKSKYGSGGRQHETTGNHGQHSPNQSFFKNGPIQDGWSGPNSSPAGTCTSLCEPITNSYEWPAKFGG